jgi:eukaryotic-like serine/threonine-protein kinase
VVRETFASGARIGDYTIDRELGHEETGVVYLGTHVVLPRQAAIKVMHGGSSYLRSVAVQMLREACMLEALAHPGIARIYECGVLPDKRPWIARERIEGESLAQTIERGPLSIVDLAVVLRDVSDLLAYAHARGVVHRALTADAIHKVADRGFETVVKNWDHALTIDTNDQVAVDPRDDVYSLGVIAYIGLTGDVPDPAVTAAERCPAAPAELTALIDHMVAIRNDARPHADEVRERARWLAATLVPLVTSSRRWTPAHVNVPLVDDTPGFAIRISRTKSSS